MSLPILIPGVLGLLALFLPLIVFFVFLHLGYEGLNAALKITLPVVLAVAVITGRPADFILSLAFSALGWSLARSAVKREEPALTGFKGLAIFVLPWAVAWIIMSITGGGSPYAELVSELDKSLTVLFANYSGSGLSADRLKEIGGAIELARKWLPYFLPVVLILPVLFMVWLNLVLANKMSAGMFPDKPAWPPYASWRLPDKLVWVIIVGGMCLFAKNKPIMAVGINLLTAVCLIYFFQGLAVMVHFLTRWRAPRLVRAFVYLIILGQGYGLLIPAVIGMGDVWFDFRKTKSNKD